MPLALPGIGVSKGTAIGRARVLQRGQIEVLEYALPSTRIEEEVERFLRALHTARQQLRSIRARIPSGTPDEIASFIDTHVLMLEDATLTSGPIEYIRTRQCNAEWALKLQQDALVKVFDAMDDSYLRTRRDDVEHVVSRVQHILLSNDAHHEPFAEDSEGLRIFFATDIPPSDLLLLHHQGIAALVTERGGPLSHTAILARSLGIPAIVGVQRAYQYIVDDELVVVDGAQGVLLANLDETELAYYRRRQADEKRLRSGLRRLKDRPAVTLDGVKIALRANIELAEDIDAMRQTGAEGVGLYRTEFLYMNRAEPPDEEEQFQIFRQTQRRLRGQPLTIRTLDLGADKEPLSATAGSQNPALGLRGIRFCLKEPELFRGQLRAILRASAYGPVRLLLPMLTDLSEVRQTRRLLLECLGQLEQEGKRFDPHLQFGGMIEVPAAAVCADGFARHLDFLSIGTNDLIQYTLATDRIDEKVNHLYNPLHPGVLRLIRTILQAGRSAAIPVSMCGEMAGDPDFTRLLLGLGLTEFSMPPAAVLEVKQVITQTNVSLLSRRVTRLLRCVHPEEVIEQLDRLNRET